MPTIALSTVLTEKVALAPIAYWSTNPAAAAGTDRSAAINEATTIDDLVFGSNFFRIKNIPKLAQTPTTPILKIFRPRAVNPPSANKNAWIIKTTDKAKVAAYGPTKTIAKAAPNKCPLVPAATGKLSICTAKINTAVKPASGALCSLS